MKKFLECYNMTLTRALFVTLLGSRAGSPAPIARMKSHPGGGSSPSKAKDRKMSDQCSQWKVGTRKSFSDSFSPDQGGSLSTLQGSDSGICQHPPNTLILKDG